MTAPAFTPQDIERRLPLWEALSNLYLDTQSDSFVPLVVNAARAGAFTLAEVDHILRWEVRPALYHNYLDPAGEWVGWPTDWLIERIMSASTAPRQARLNGDAFLPDEWPEIQAALS